MAPGQIVINGEDPFHGDPVQPGDPDGTLPQQPARDNIMHGDDPARPNGYVNGTSHNNEASLPNGHAASYDQTHLNGHAFNHGQPHLNGDAANHDEPHLNGHHHSRDHSQTESISSGSAPPLNGFKTPSSNDSVSGEAKANTNVPIAVVGIAVRAGSASTPDEFFEMLSRGRSAFSSEIPAERFNNASFYHPNAGKLGCINTNGASFIQQDVTKFDAPFFNITELEATSMDPQQRLLLECAFEALESAGVQKHATVGKDVGVFVGAGSPEYEFDLFRDSDTMPMFQATGNHLAMQSNKISHFFDWRGPSVTMDTACSSSLTAVHYACQSIRNRESEVALVGGCNLNLIPEFFINYSTSRLLGNDGKSFSFDARGTGYGRGEGCGMILLKPLDQALKDNDPVRAVIAASGVNQDGYTPGITMPNGESQEALIRAIYRNAGLDPSQTGYVEAHGTGTRVGDPIEVTALHNVFNEGRTRRNPLYIGSVKSNIGHLESASGILAVIKTAVMLDRGFILPNYDFKEGNLKIPFAEWSLKVPTGQLPWPRGKRFASVNNFGFGGTNAHVVMERAPVRTKNETVESTIKEPPVRRLFVLSAADKVACQTLMSNLAYYLERRPEMFQRDIMSNVAYTLGQRRSLLPWRVAIPAIESVNLVEKLTKGTIKPVKESSNLRIGFVCTGQGAQWWAMGRELYERYPIFTQTIDKASAVLTYLGAPYSLIEELSRDAETTQVNQAHISQPSCTAIQLGLIDVLRSWGVVPTAAIGHSSGEIAAAYAAGMLSVESAMEIAYHRGRLVPVLKERYPDLDGTMLAIGCGKEDVDPLIQQLSEREARIACYNSPSSLTISGDTPAIVELSTLLEEKQIFNRRLVIETAYHSHHMELIAKDYFESIADLPPPEKSDVRFFSSLTGKEASYADLDSSYWVSNLTNPVKFAQACAHLVAPSGDSPTGVDIIVEIGPHSALQGPVKQTLKAVGGAVEKIPYASTLTRKKSAIDTMLDLASTLFCKGSQLDLGNVNFPKIVKTPSLVVDYPTYPWNHSNTYWHESRIARLHKNREFPRHDLLGTLANYSNDLEPTWRNIVRLDDLPWLRHHKIQGLTIFPISGFVGIVVEAAWQQAKSKDIDVGQLELRDLIVHTPLMIPDESVELTITLRSPQAADVGVTQITSDFLIHSHSKTKGWTENCTGIVSVRIYKLNDVDGQIRHRKKAESLAETISAIETTATVVQQPEIYDTLTKLGVDYGSTFQGLTDCCADEHHAAANITVADTAAEMPEHFETKHIIHPAFLEQLVQMYWPILGAGRTPLDTVCLPASIGRLTLSPKILEHASSPGQTLRSYCTVDKALSVDKPSKVSMFAVAGEETIITIDDLTIAPLPATEGDDDTQPPRDLCYKQIWEPFLEPLNGAQNTRVDSPQAEDSDGTALPATPVLIIHGGSESQLELARLLALTLESNGNVQVELGKLEDVDASDRNCICITELDEFILATLAEAHFLALQTLLRKAHSLLWITRGAYGQKGDPTGNMVSGFSRAIRSETMFKFAHLDLDAEERLEDKTAIQAILRVFKFVVQAKTAENTEMEFQERKGEFWTPRIVNDDAIDQYVHKRRFPPSVEETKFGGSSRALKMAISTPGAVDSLYFVDDERKEHELAADEIEIQVKAIAVSARDVRTLTGHLDASSFGEQCSGIVNRVGQDVSSLAVGDRVAALASAAFATYTRTKASFTIKVGATISFENAANLPLAHASARYGLIDLARLEDEESVLVLNGASAMGQAAVSLAQTIGSTVFATVATTEDKALLMQEFDLPEYRIFYSKDDRLSSAMLDSTGNKGIDVVLSAQADVECVQSALNCVAQFGRFIREETSDVSSKGKIDLSALDGNTGFFSFDFHSLATAKPRILQRLIKEISRSWKLGNLRPVEGIKVMPIGEVSEAFKLARSTSSSRIVVVPHHDDIVKTTPSKQIINLFREDATYVLIGGTGGLGREMTRWMAAKGAKHIVLLSRSGSVTGPVKTLVDDLSRLGISVVVHSCNVVKREDVDLLLKKLVGLPPIRGIIHTAMVLRDTLFDKMTLNDWTEIVESKVQGAWNFHNALESVPLDFFILYSSCAAAMGGRGQASYAAANTFIDAFAQYRRSLGLHGASLGPAAVLDAGYLAENMALYNDIQRNIGAQNYILQAEVISLLEAILDGTAKANCNDHIITGVSLDPLKMPFWASDAKYKDLRIAAEATAALLNQGSKSISWNTAFKAAESLPEAEQVVCDGLVEKIAKTLGLEQEELDPTRNLSNYALDSLTAIDVRNFIVREFEATLQVLELLASGTIQTLAKAVCAKSKLLKSTS